MTSLRTSEQEYYIQKFIKETTQRLVSRAETQRGMAFALKCGC